MHPYMGRGAGQLHPRKLKLAMRLPKTAGGSYVMQSMQARHWHRFALGTGGASLWLSMRQMAMNIEAVLQAVHRIFPPTFRTRYGPSSAPACAIKPPVS